ncbi:26S proteasome non-ATPase regulatory subunit 8 homolog A-like [Nymphaea colorata]|nr:26S proteasome non-ATPase regulatory subunit 8 homolog A-like [Nymphaea colorata]
MDPDISLKDGPVILLNFHSQHWLKLYLTADLNLLDVFMCRCPPLKSSDLLMKRKMDAYYSLGLIPPSPQEYQILGLNLLRLLVQNRIAEFHTELELLSASALENPCIKHALELKQYFMEGACNCVLSARQTVPHSIYVYFMDLLAKTVRDEIAGCSEKAYDYLTIADAKQILMFSSEQELLEYITEEHPDWEVRNGCVFFQKAKGTTACKEIPSLQLINQTLGYARKLQGIV